MQKVIYVKDLFLTHIYDISSTVLLFRGQFTLLHFELNICVKHMKESHRDKHISLDENPIQYNSLVKPFSQFYSNP